MHTRPVRSIFSLAVLVTASTLLAQDQGVQPGKPRVSSPFAVDESTLAKGPAPRLADGHPDLSGYWLPSKKDRPSGDIGKDYPEYKLPFTDAGRAALKHNVEQTVDPEALCVVGGIPRHDASALPFQLLQGKSQVAFLYWYTTYRLIPFDVRKHEVDPDF